MRATRFRSGCVRTQTWVSRSVRGGATCRLTGGAPAQFDPAALFVGAKRLAGLMVGSRAMTEDLARFVERRQLRPVIDRVFGFDEAQAAYDYLGQAAHLGKVVIAT